MEKRREIEERTLDSSQRSLGLLHESEKVGMATAEELARQKEQLRGTEQRLDDINSTLKQSERHLQGIKGIFGGLRNYFSGKGPAAAAAANAAGSSKRHLILTSDRPIPWSDVRPRIITCQCVRQTKSAFTFIHVSSFLPRRDCRSGGSECRQSRRPWRILPGRGWDRRSPLGTLPFLAPGSPGEGSLGGRPHRLPIFSHVCLGRHQRAAGQEPRRHVTWALETQGTRAEPQL